MNRFIKNNKASVSIILFLLCFYIIYTQKPSVFFNNDVCSISIFFDKLIIEGDKATFFWRMVDDTLIASGQDILTIQNGEITHQVVHLDSEDF